MIPSYKISTDRKLALYILHDTAVFGKSFAAFFPKNAALSHRISSSLGAFVMICAPAGRSTITSSMRTPKRPGM